MTSQRKTNKTDFSPLHKISSCARPISLHSVCENRNLSSQVRPGQGEAELLRALLAKKGHGLAWPNAQPSSCRPSPFANSRPSSLFFADLCNAAHLPCGSAGHYWLQCDIQNYANFKKKKNEDPFLVHNFLSGDKVPPGGVM